MPTPDFNSPTLFPPFLSLPLTTTTIPPPGTEGSQAALTNFSSLKPHKIEYPDPSLQQHDYYLMATVLQNMTITKPTLILTDSTGQRFALVYADRVAPGPFAGPRGGGTVGPNVLDLGRKGFKAGSTTVVLKNAKRNVVVREGWDDQIERMRTGMGVDLGLGKGNEFKEEDEEEVEKAVGEGDDAKKEKDGGQQSQSQNNGNQNGGTTKRKRKQGSIRISKAEEDEVKIIPGKLEDVQRVGKYLREREQDEAKGNSCAQCGAQGGEDKSLKQCTGCRGVKYCGKVGSLWERL